MRYIEKYNKALRAIAPTSSFQLSGNDENSMQISNWSDDNISQPTDAEVKSKIIEIETAKANEENQKATDKASGNQKLLDLGLTQAEATALTGYTPPTEV
jgi:hypothetical protein